MIKFSLKTKSSNAFFLPTSSLSGRIFYFPFLKTFPNNVKAQHGNQTIRRCKYLHAKKPRKPHLILCAPYYYQWQQFSFDKNLGWGESVCKAFLIALKSELFFASGIQLIRYLIQLVEEEKNLSKYLHVHSTIMLNSPQKFKLHF